jgi:hypothetical protein
MAGSAYFKQCPNTFNECVLTSFQWKVQSRQGQWLVKSLKEFSQETLRKWSQNGGKQSLSIHLGLIDIYESALKECEAITLDLLLYDGILVEGENCSWELARAWETHWIYLYRDAKTITNITKFVRDRQEQRILY